MVDIDEQPELRKGDKIENVPTVKVFKAGDVVRMGEHRRGIYLQPVKDFGVYCGSNELREQAMNKLFMIFDKEPEYKEGAAKEKLINISILPLSKFTSKV